MKDNESKQQKWNDINGFDQDLALHCIVLLRELIRFDSIKFVCGFWPFVRILV